MACAVEDSPVTPCRLWHGPNIRGYGRKYDRSKKRTVMLHRWVWEQINAKPGMWAVQLRVSP